MRAFAHYGLAVVLLTIYGGQVCPFIESLSVASLALTLASWFMLFYLLRQFIGQRLVRQAPALQQAMRQFNLDLATFLLCGLGLAFFNMAFYVFPFASGLKLVAGCLCLGFFSATDLGLERDYLVAQDLARQGNTASLAPRFTSLTRKLAMVAAAVALSTALVLLLVILHDLSWIRSLGPEAPLRPASRSILLDFVFVLTVLLLLSTNLLLSFTRNLKLAFSRQTETLEQVAQGRLHGFVPVTSSDEFGIIARYTNDMISGLRQRTKELLLTQDATIHSLASLAETRDNETGQHIIRTQNYVKALAQQLQDQPGYGARLDQAAIELLYKSAPLHDIGKVGIPDSILLKPGRLTDDEFSIMKRHAALGHEALQTAMEELGDNSFLRLAQEIAHSHHEKWDGSGYPQGLAGEAIPLSGRLMALADVYDALISKRVYKPAFSHDKAASIVREGRGSHFDPAIVDAFDQCEEQFRQIAQAHADKEN